ncbi:MAG: hypothetical protein KF773_30220 [Deltaproteobacteria bacterium]|nr:hypothetical protein [Deltaproteobacteria bacterium]MCW5806827.1 hypothetical protein [Deltaproteobacteria bacterium]
MMKSVFLSATALLFLACGPAGRPNNGGDDDGNGPDASDQLPPDSSPVVASPEVCTDGIDNDLDGRVDCADPDCSGRDGCPVCGEVENPEGTAIALPDGVNAGSTTTCSTDAQCTNPALPNCISGGVKECHASYVSTLNFVGFPQGAKLTDPTKLQAICVNMEHSWLRDLQIELVTPDNAVFIMHKFLDRSGGEIYLGQAYDPIGEDPANPTPGVGETYCWTPTAPVQMVTSATVNGPTTNYNGHQMLVPGNYKPASPWTALTNTTLNGMWSIRVTDLWPIDNGYVFSWSIKFDASLVDDCSGPIIM